MVDMETQDLMERRQPFIKYNRGNLETSISEAFLRLDMTNAVKEIRRFNYLCKLLQLLFNSQLPSLSGTAQKQVFSILEAASEHALKTECNLSTIRQLLKSADLALLQGQRSHIGSDHLWVQHRQKFNKIASKVDAYRMTEREPDGKLTIMDLPDECIRGILCRLPDHEDILQTSATSTSMYQLSQEWQFWKQLCFFHFTDRQLITFFPDSICEPNDDWKQLYRRCFKKYGKKESYADMLALCVHCKNLFWMKLGHPCYSEEPQAFTPLTPEAFLKLFYL